MPTALAKHLSQKPFPAFCSKNLCTASARVTDPFFRRMRSEFGNEPIKFGIREHRNQRRSILTLQREPIASRRWFPGLDQVVE